MTSSLSCESSSSLLSSSQSEQRWSTFEEILKALHHTGIYLHPHQLAEFFLAHGLPVHLRYVPAHLREKAISINKNYQGDMAAVIEETDEQSWDFSWYL